MDATHWEKAWHLPTGVTFLDPCQTFGVNKEILGERQRQGWCWHASSVPASYLNTSPSPCPLSALGMMGRVFYWASPIKDIEGRDFFSCCMFAQHLVDRVCVSVGLLESKLKNRKEQQSCRYACLSSGTSTLLTLAMLKVHCVTREFLEYHSSLLW